MVIENTGSTIANEVAVRNTVLPYNLADLFILLINFVLALSTLLFIIFSIIIIVRAIEHIIQKNKVDGKPKKSISGLPALCVFLFMVIIGAFTVRIMFTNVIGKPVIYLYPENEERVVVKLNFKGSYEFTYPKYDKTTGGWDIYAKPDGTITDPRDGRTYSYLFWEGTSINKSYDMTRGWVVEGSKVVEFLRQKLAEFGFTEKEYNDFIVYWGPILQKNNYNLIHFATTEYEEVAVLEVKPKPDTTLRVLMVYKPVSHKFEIIPQDIKTVTRRGFTLVEWGGTKVN